MFDFRYHALSLVAVFIALALGLLLGVAIGDSGLVSNAERNIREDLRGDVRAANRRADEALESRDRLAEELRASLPLMTDDRLTGSVGMVFLGQNSQAMADNVREALAGSGAERASVATIREPLDLDALAGDARGTRYAQLDADDPDLDLVESLGFRLGAQYVLPGRLLARAQDALFSSLAGRLDPLQGVIVVRAQPGGMSKREDTVADRFEIGFVRGLRETRVRVVGVEQSSTRPSQVSWFEQRGISTVDDVERTVGRAALVYVLAGARGNFGRKPTAEALVPQP
ncbi:MAG TPA: copper transporter [Solirubrobacteraceae bacterium]